MGDTLEEIEEITAPAPPVPAGSVLTRPSLVAHVFVELDGDDAGQAWRRLRGVWAECVRAWGLSEPVGPATADVLPATPPAPGDGVVAARRAPGTPLTEVGVRVDGDLATLSARLVPEPDDPVGWAGLERCWAEVGAAGSAAGSAAGRAAGDPGDDVLGSVVLFRAETRDQEPAALDAAVAAHAPPATDPQWPEEGAGPWRGPRVWELVPDRPDDGRAHRRLVVVVDGAHAAAWDGWTWEGDGTAERSLVRYLRVAARLRAEVRRRRADEHLDARRTVSAVDDEGRRLLADLAGGATGPADRDRAGSRTRLLAVLGELRRARAAAATTHARLVATVPAAGGLFTVDGDLADRVVADLDEDLAHAERVRAQEADLDTLAADTARRDLVAAQRRSDATRGRVAVLQTAAIAAVLLAVVALVPTVPLVPSALLAPALRLPVAAGLGALAVWLTAMILVTTMTRPVARGLLALVVTAAAAGVLTGAGVVVVRGLRGAAPLTEVVTGQWAGAGALGGAAITVLVLAVRTRRRRRRSR